MIEAQAPASVAQRKASPIILQPDAMSLALHRPSIFQADWDAIMPFAMRDMKHLPPILSTAPIPAIAELAYDLQNVTRKVSGEPYFKHVFRTVMLVCDEAVLTGLAPSDARVLTGAAYLHDALELQKKAHHPYSEEDLSADLRARGVDRTEAARIASLVSVLTPSKEGSSFTDDTRYIRYKLQNFRKKFTGDHEDARLLHLIKAADMLANMEETVDDLRNGRKDENMHRPIGARIRIFSICVKIVEKYDSANPFLPRLHEVLKELEKTF